MTTNEAVGTDGCKMMNGDTTAQDHVVVDMYVTTEHNIVGHHHTITNAAVVGNMSVGHQIAVVTDCRNAILFFGRAIDRDAFANNVAIAKNHLRGRSLVTQVLRLAADYRTGMNMIVLTERRMACDRNMIL